MRAAAPTGCLARGAEDADQALPAPAAAVALGLAPLRPGLLSLLHHELLEADAAPRVARGDPLVQAGLQLPRTLADGQEPRGAHLQVVVGNARHRACLGALAALREAGGLEREEEHVAGLRGAPVPRPAVDERGQRDHGVAARRLRPAARPHRLLHREQGAPVSLEERRGKRLERGRCEDPLTALQVPRARGSIPSEPAGALLALESRRVDLAPAQLDV
mmetsp:Transcript_18019/g.45185  ORF Transcript_18019/g.45185 Transcript_18019/m.45185 type:complete len:219 (+) Transcript_18019:135-791(+)